MKRKLSGLVWILVLVLGFTVACSSSADDEALIRESFEGYRSALLDADGEAAYQWVDLKTREWYDQVLEYSLTLNRNDLDRLDILDRFMVLQLRHEFSRGDLEDLTGEKVFNTGVERGWISRSSVEGLQLDLIEVDGLQGSVIFEGYSGEPLFLFVKEEGQWKLMLSKLSATAAPAFEQMVIDSGMEENAFLIALLEASSSFRVDDAILDGPVE